jgi:hypothetical protein
MLKKKIWANFQRIIKLFTKKFVKKLLKIWSWDPGSEIRDPEKTYSGSRIQGKKHPIPDPGSGSATLINRIFEAAESGSVKTYHKKTGNPFSFISTYNQSMIRL